MHRIPLRPHPSTRNFESPFFRCLVGFLQSVIDEAARHLRDLRVAEVMKKDLVIRYGKVEAYRTKIKLSFKYEPHR